MKPNRVLAYARVSSEEQARGSSISDQKDAISSYAKSQEYGAPTFYAEHVSAVHEKIEKRVRMQALLADVQAGDLVLCAKIDRWSRDPEFTYKTVRELLAAKVSVYFVDDRCDPSTPEGDTMMNFRILFAREEAKRIKERMVGTRKLLRDRGYYVEGTPPVGYRRSLPKGSKGPDKNVLVIDGEGAALVCRVFRLCIAGDSIRKIARKVDAGVDSVGSILSSRTYVGEIRNTKGEWIRGKHPPIIDADTFTRAQAAIANRKKGTAKPRGDGRTSGWILRDVVTCARCGARMSAAYSGMRKGSDYVRFYYLCSKRCGASHVPVDMAEGDAEPLIVAHLETLREQLSKEAAPEQPKATSDFQARRDANAKKRERHQEAFAAGATTIDELRRHIARLDQESLRIDAEEQAEVRPNPLANRKVKVAVLKKVGAIRVAWTRLTPEEKRQIVRYLTQSAALERYKEPVMKWRNLEDLASESV